jgi:hypothetical protein
MHHWKRATLLGLALCASSAPVAAQQKGQPITKSPDSPADVLPAAGGSVLLVGGGDDCSTPDLIIGTGAFAYDLTTATTGLEGQANPNCTFFGQPGIDNDVWFVWSAPAAGVYQIDTCGSTQDTKLAVYDTSSCPTSVTALACDDDLCNPGVQSLVTICAGNGQTFFIQVGLFPGAAVGAGTLNITNTSACVPNDLCSTPTALGSSTGNFPYDNTNATTGSEGQGDVACLLFGSSAIANDLWYTWTAPASGSLTVSTCNNTTLDTKLAIWAGAGCPAAAALACSDDDCGAGVFTSSASTTVTGGQTYTIQVGNFPGTAGGASSMDIAFSAGPCSSNISTYCTALISSNGCSPAMGTIGSTASLANPTGFSVTGSSLEAGQNGLIFFGTTGPDNSPFFGGTLCVLSPLYRMNVQNSGGSLACSGSMANTLADLLGHPVGGSLLVANQPVNVQVWTRDPPSATTVSLSNGLQFTICP